MPGLPSDFDVRVYFFDVEHGHAALIKTKGKSMLIDGGDIGKLEPAMRRLNVYQEADYGIITHWDQDHYSGFQSGGMANTLYYSEYSALSYVYLKYEKQIAVTNDQDPIPINLYQDNLCEVQCTIFAPPASVSTSENKNSHSLGIRLVVKFRETEEREWGETTFLILGDATEEEVDGWMAKELLLTVGFVQ